MYSVGVGAKIEVRRGSEGLHLNIIFGAVIYICVEFTSTLCEGWRKIVEQSYTRFQDRNGSRCLTIRKRKRCESLCIVRGTR